MNPPLTELLGDGVACQLICDGGRCHCVFSIYNEEVARSYVDEQGQPRVDVCNRTAVGLDGFKRMIVLWALAWSRAEQLAVLVRSGQAAKPDAICEKCNAPLVNGWECQCDPLGLNANDEDCGPCPCGEPDCPNCRK